MESDLESFGSLLAGGGEEDEMVVVVAIRDSAQEAPRPGEGTERGLVSRVGRNEQRLGTDGGEAQSSRWRGGEGAERGVSDVSMGSLTGPGPSLVVVGAGSRRRQAGSRAAAGRAMRG